METDWELRKQSLVDEIQELNKKIRGQQWLLERLHYLDLNPFNADVYYEQKKDWSRFVEPKDRSQREAERDAGITHFLKLKKWVSESAFKEYKEKRTAARLLQKEYAEQHLEDVNKQREHFNRRKERNHSCVDTKQAKLIARDSEEVEKYFCDVLYGDEIIDDLYTVHVPILHYDPETSELSYSYDISNAETINEIEEYALDEKERKIQAKVLTKADAERIRLTVARAILFRSASMIYNSDTYDLIQSIHITGIIQFFNPAYGKIQYKNVLTATIPKKEFMEICPEKVDLDIAFKMLFKANVSPGLYRKQSHELTEIKTQSK